MTARYRFPYKSREQLQENASEMRCRLPFNEDLSLLFKPLDVRGKRIANRMAVHPMEGCDAGPDGSPGLLTLKRYLRYAEGGSGLIWFEASSVSESGRSSPAQLWLHPNNVNNFRTLVEKTRRRGREIYGSKHRIFCILQLTHSGRYSRPQGNPFPQAAFFNPLLDAQYEGVKILSDTELDGISRCFIRAAGLAYEAGFDGVDIKACHGYLVNELLGAYIRSQSRYGGGFQNRARFLLESMRKIHLQSPGLILSSRISACDTLPFPYGFGFIHDETGEIDLSEVKELIRHMLLMGCHIFNITAGNPHYNPHISRPDNRPVKGTSLPEEHPLEGVCRLIKVCADLQKSFPNVPFVGTGYSWLRQFFPFAAAGVLEENEAALIGLGRNSFAYPDAPKDLMEKGLLDPKKVCVACSRCSELLQSQRITGCAVRGPDVYRREYKKLRRTGGNHGG